MDAPIPHRIALVVLALGLGSNALAARPLAAGPPSIVRDEEGAVRNSTPLPSARAAEEALAAGDAQWELAMEVEGRNRFGPRNAAFDAWREALLASDPMEGVRLAALENSAHFPDPDNTHARRAEGVDAAVQRRLATLPPLDRVAWEDRIGPLAAGALQIALEQSLGPQNTRQGGASEARGGLALVERNHPFTPAATRAALALFDLSLENGRPVAASAWLGRAIRHGSWTPSLQSEPLDPAAQGALPASHPWSGAFQARGKALASALSESRGQDHTRQRRSGRVAPQASDSAPPGDEAESVPPNAAGGATLPRPVNTLRISRLVRRSDEPFGLGLDSGIAFFEDGAAVVQGAHGLLSLVPSENGQQVALGLSGAIRYLSEELFDIRPPVVRAAPSAGGWPSLPATDGSRVALVMDRGRPQRRFRDVELDATGNVLGLCGQGPEGRPIEPLWVLRDGVVAMAPHGTRRAAPDKTPPFRDLADVFSRSGVALGTWDLGTGWEFQPGPVLVDNTVFVLARGLGGASSGDEDRADEVRLLALSAASADLLWSVSITKERGLLDGSRRGAGGYYAATTMPLTINRATGTLLVGTNSGLLMAVSAADGRLLWALRNQRRAVDQGGWPGSRSPLLVPASSGAAGTATAWFAPFDSGFCYALPAGPAPLDGPLFIEAPRERGHALDLAAVLPTPGDGQGPERSTLLLLGRHGRHSALLVDRPEGLRQPAAYLAPGDRFGGSGTLDASGTKLWVAGTAELSGFAAARDFSLSSAAPLTSQGAGTGGNAIQRGDFLYVLGRDTVWVYDLGSHHH